MADDHRDLFLVNQLECLNEQFYEDVLIHLKGMEEKANEVQDDKLSTLLDEMRSALEQDVLGNVPWTGGIQAKFLSVHYKAITDKQMRVVEVWDKVADRIAELQDAGLFIGVPQQPAIHWPNQ
jgi:hypothetical protein